MNGCGILFALIILSHLYSKALFALCHEIQNLTSNILHSRLATYFVLAGSPVRGGCSSWSPPGGIFIFQICGVA